MSTIYPLIVLLGSASVLLLFIGILLLGRQTEAKLAIRSRLLSVFEMLIGVVVLLVINSP